MTKTEKQRLDEVGSAMWAAHQAGRHAERAEIVAWLRWEQTQNAIVDVGGRSERSAHRFAIACKVIADSLESGDHREKQDG